MTGTQLGRHGFDPRQQSRFPPAAVVLLPGFLFARRRAGVPLGRWPALFDGAAGGGWNARCEHLTLGVLG